MAGARQGAKRKKAKRRRVVDEYCTYIVEITDWDLTYLYSLDEDKYATYPYSEYLNLEVRGIIREPEKYAGLEMSSTFMGKRELILHENNRSFTERKPIGVGGLTLRGKYRQFLGSLPYDSIPVIASMLDSKRIQYFHLHGLKPHYGHATIKSIYFFRNLDPEEE
jgi:hypothetical protein